MFYAILSLKDQPFCLSIAARDLQSALDQVNAFCSGIASCGEFVPSIDAIQATKPRGLEAQAIAHYVKVPK